MSTFNRGQKVLSELQKIENSARSLRPKLRLVAELLDKEWRISSYFCEIKGPRWSYYAGDVDFVMPLYRIQLTDKYGLMTDQILIPADDWEAMLALIRRIIENTKEAA